MKGLTLIEILIVMVIIAILSTLSYNGYSKWVQKQKIEKDTRILYTQILESRIKAFTEKITCGITWENSVFNEIHFRCDNDSDEEINDDGGYIEIKSVKLHSFFKSTFESQFLKFTPQGFSNTWGTLYSTQDNIKPEYNCITVSLTKVRMGYWDGTKCKER